MLGIAGLVLAVVAIVAIVALIWRGWHMVVVSLVASLVVILSNGMDVLSAINESYMGDMAAFVGSWFLLFALGSVFGRVMGDSGASAGIANSMLRLVGEKHALLVIMVTAASARSSSPSRSTPSPPSSSSARTSPRSSSWRPSWPAPPRSAWS